MTIESNIYDIINNNELITFPNAVILEYNDMNNIIYYDNSGIFEIESYFGYNINC